MTVASSTSRVSFAGAGTTTAFATSPVIFFDTTDLQVYLIDSAGVATLKTISTDYSVTGGLGALGTVTTVFTAAVGESVLIVRELPLTQGSDFVNNDVSDAEVAEDALDKLTMISQQLNETLGRSIKVPVSSSLTGLEMPDLSGYAGYAIIVNATEDGFDFANSLSTTGVTVSAFMETVLDDTSAATARATLGAVIGTDVQAWGAVLDDLRGVTQAADKFIYFDTATTAATADVTSFARTLLDDADAATARTTLLAKTTLGTVQVTTGAASFEFTSIPAGVRRVSVTLQGVSVAGATAGYGFVQIGPSAAVETTGYTSAVSFISNAAVNGLATFTNGMIGSWSAAASDTCFSKIDMVLTDAATNTWHYTMLAYVNSATSYTLISSGYKALAGELSRLKLLLTGATTFDAGSINIEYNY